jgi:hypothetical protein
MKKGDDPVAQCSNCRYLGPPGEHDSAPPVSGPTCRRHAPVATGGMMSGSRTMWPIVQPDDWCGDWESFSAYMDRRLGIGSEP